MFELLTCGAAFGCVADWTAWRNRDGLRATGSDVARRRAPLHHDRRVRRHAHVTYCGDARANGCCVGPSCRAIGCDGDARANAIGVSRCAPSRRRAAVYYCAAHDPWTDGVVVRCAAAAAAVRLDRRRRRRCVAAPIVRDPGAMNADAAAGFVVRMCRLCPIAVCPRPPSSCDRCHDRRAIHCGVVPKQKER